MRVGTQFRFEAATWFIGRDFDLDGKRTFILQSATRTPGVLPDTLGAVDGMVQRSESETWLGESASGLVLYATSPKRVLPYPLLIIPSVVRDGMKWEISGGGAVIAEGLVEGGMEIDTIHGRRRTWHIVITRKAPAGRQLAFTVAEGRGLISVDTSEAPGSPTVDVVSAIVPLEASPAPAPITLTPMEPLYGGERLTPRIAMPGFGVALKCQGNEADLDITSLRDVPDFDRFGAGGSYISAIEDAAGAFDLRIGGSAVFCDDKNNAIPTWRSDSLVWGAKLSGNDAIPTTEPRVGYEAPTPQDARTSVWMMGGSQLVFHPTSQNGDRQQGLFYRPPPDMFGQPFEGVFAHSGSGTFIDFDGEPVSLSPGDGVSLISTSFPMGNGNYWYWPQQPTAVFGPRRGVDPLPIGRKPLILADADFIANGGSTAYIVDVYDRLASGRIEDLPDAAPNHRFAMSGLRDGPLSADPLTTILRRDNTRETFLAQHHGGIWKIDATDQGLRRRLLARPAIPEGHQVIGAFQSGDHIFVATNAGTMYLSPEAGGFAVATGYVSLWRLPVVPGAQPEPFPSHLELNFTADGHDLRVEQSPDAATPSLTGWTLAGEPVRALEVPTEREVGDEPGIAIPRKAILLNRRNIPPVGPELSLPAGLSDPVPPPLPALYPGQGELGAYHAEGPIAGLGRVAFAGRAPRAELAAGPGYPDPPILLLEPDEHGETSPAPVVRDRRTGDRWVLGAWTTPTGSCSASHCLPISLFIDRAPTTAAHPAAFLPTTHTWLVPAEGVGPALRVVLAPIEGGIVVEVIDTGAAYHVSTDGTIAPLAFPARTETSQWVGGPSLDPAVPGALSRCNTNRNESARTVSVTCATRDGHERTTETLIEPELNYGGGQTDYDHWPGADADNAPFVARTSRSRWMCDVTGRCNDGGIYLEYRAHRLDLAAMRFRAHSDTIAYHRARDGELYAVTMLFDYGATAWRLFHVTDHGFVLLGGGIHPTGTGTVTPIEISSDDIFLKLMLADGWFRIPLDDARAATSTCDFHALSSSAGCVCPPGFTGDGTTCAPALGSLGRPVRDCSEWYAAGQPALGQHNPVIDPDGAGPRLPYVTLCAIEAGRLLVWPYVANSSLTTVKLDRDTFAPIECVEGIPAGGTPDYYAYAYQSGLTYYEELRGEFELTFTLTHTNTHARAGLHLDVADGFHPMTLAYEGIADVCTTASWPRPEHIAIVADNRFPAHEHAFRVIEGSATGDVETDLPAAFQSQAILNHPLKLSRDGAGILTLTSGSASYTFPHPHPGVLRVMTEGRLRLTDPNPPNATLVRIALPLPP